MKKKYPFREIWIEALFALILVFGLLVYRCTSEPIDRTESDTYKAFYFDGERYLAPLD